MKHIALVTYDDMPDLTPSDQLLREKLSAHNIQSSAISWHDTTIDWRQFDAVIIRTTWNYHQHPVEFKAWLTQMEEQGVRLYNPAPTLLWNMRKTYLRQLSDMGILIIPTVWASQTEPQDLKSVLGAQGWTEALLKPVFGAGSKGIKVINIHAVDEAQATLDQMLTLGEVMIQPIIKEVRNGELSMVYFNHEYSHTIRKTPQGDDVLLDSSKPNATQIDDAPEFAVEIGLNILEQTQKLMETDPFLYARVDGVIVDGEFLLMELELLEPHLFLNLAGDDAAERFAKVIDNRISAS